MDQFESRKALNPNLGVKQFKLKKDETNEVKFLDEIPKS